MLPPPGVMPGLLPPGMAAPGMMPPTGLPGIGVGVLPPPMGSIPPPSGQAESNIQAENAGQEKEVGGEAGDISVKDN